MRNREKEVRQKKSYDIKTTTCPMDCGDACSLLATIANGKVVSLQGDPEHPFTQGIMCNKMRRYPERLFGPERLTTPLIRKNGCLEPCSWDNAIDAICARWRSDIKEYGSESVMSWSYSGPMGMFQRNSGDAFFGTLGATSLDRTICATARSFALRESLGVRGVSLPDDFVPGDVILVWSMDPARSRLAFTRRLTQARRQGASVVLVDVYENATARLADHVSLVTPGRDLQLALLLLAKIAQAAPTALRSADEALTRFSDVVAHAKALDANESEHLCGLSPESVSDLAERLLKANRVYLITGYGYSRTQRGAAATQALVALSVALTLTGVGGGMYTMLGANRVFETSTPSAPHVPATARRTNMSHLGEALLDFTDPPIRSLYVYGSNPALVSPDQSRVLEGLRRDDLFLVVHDLFLTDTARLADVVLPATSFLEHDDLYLRGEFPVLQYSRAIIDPVGESKSNCEVFGMFAKCFGFSAIANRYNVGLMIREAIDNTEYPFTEEERQRVLAGKPVLLEDRGTGALDKRGRFSGYDTADFSCLATWLDNAPASCVDAFNWFDDDASVRSRATLGQSNGRKQGSGRTFYLATVITDFSINSSVLHCCNESRRNAYALMNPVDVAECLPAGSVAVTLENRFGRATFELEPSKRVPRGTIIVPGVYPLGQTLAGSHAAVQPQFSSASASNASSCAKGGLGINAFAPPLESDGGDGCWFTGHQVKVVHV